MKKFLVLYPAPLFVLDEWRKTEPATRKAAEEKMQREWKQWTADHARMFADVGAWVGRTKRISAQGSSVTRNDIMLYAIVEAASHEAASRSFEDHPHLQIPEVSIEVMEIHGLPGLQ